MKRRRVKITGIGPVTPAGIGREEFWQGILEPVSRVRPYTKVAAEFGVFVAAYLSDFRVESFVDRTVLPKGASRQTHFAIAGALLAMKDAKVSVEELREAKCSIITGSSLMDFGGIGGTIEAVSKRGTRGAQPRVLLSMGVSSVPSALNDVFGTAARTKAISTWCAAGMDAIGSGAELVATGEADIVLCGGTEAPLHRFPLVELRAAELTPGTDEMAPQISRPFDLWRTTGVVSEGACMFILEPESSRRSGYCYVAGYSFANDLREDLCSGMEMAGRTAMADAGIHPRDIEAIFAWGPGHKLVDRGEAQALQRLFGGDLERIPATSIKGAIGTTLGAAPAIDIAAAALAQRSGIIPPTVNWERPDPECPLSLSNACRHIPHARTLLNAHGFEGVNASLILERC